jgi:hypothetical protein
MTELHEVICERCGTVAAAGTLRPGSTALEVFLWCLMLLPACIPYSIWRSSNKSRVCAQCGSADIVSIETPHGRQLMAARSRW